MVDRDRTGGQFVPGDTIGPWVVLERLDAGSFGSVFRCQRAGHPSAGDFALKLARNPEDPRFEREAELLQLGLPGQPHFEDQGLWTALGVSLMLALVLLLARLSPGEQETPWLATPEGIAQVAPDAGVGEAVLESVQDLPHTTTPAMMVLTRPMPSQAFPGQKKPPCHMDYEIAALGACWVRLEKKPPCGSGGYELDGLCVRAVFPAPRQPTSEDP